MFEATRSGFDGQLALDDVAFVTGPCSLPTMCSFESQTCGYTSSGRARWIHHSWNTDKTGPETDHSLETEKGEGNLKIKKIGERGEFTILLQQQLRLHD